MNNKTVNGLGTVLFFGGLWGLIEATLGYVLQLMPPLVSGFVMFPIATIILTMTYFKTRSIQSLFMVGLFAAMIKGINLFFPIFPWKTINPMVAIILETLVLATVMVFVVKKSPRTSIIALLSASVLWRGLYLGYMGLQYVFIDFLHDSLTSISAVLTFMVLHGLISGLIAIAIYLTMRTTVHAPGFYKPIRPVYGSVMVIAAILFTVFL
ncbi:MAG: hypothetical protein ACOCU2_01265 [Bacillota bacterium]